MTFEEKLDNELPKFVKAELIHIHCNTFCGTAIYKLNNKLFCFGLGTPNFNDYGEYRVGTEFKIHEIEEGANVPKTELDKNEDIFLTLDQAEWWMNEDVEMTEFMQEAEVRGGKQGNNFVIYDKEDKLVNFFEWENREHDAYEHFMFNVLKTFYYWCREGRKGNIE